MVRHRASHEDTLSRQSGPTARPVGPECRETAPGPARRTAIPASAPSAERSSLHNLLDSGRRRGPAPANNPSAGQKGRTDATEGPSCGADGAYRCEQGRFCGAGGASVGEIGCDGTKATALAPPNPPTALAVVPCRARSVARSCEVWPRLASGWRPSAGAPARARPPGPLRDLNRGLPVATGAAGDETGLVSSGVG